MAIVEIIPIIVASSVEVSASVPSSSRRIVAIFIFVFESAMSFFMSGILYDAIFSSVKYVFISCSTVLLKSALTCFSE
ncbi:unknown [Tannerella sp. CAG:118]|nr:unknown [Tannerella sp. CAG:118]